MNIKGQHITLRAVEPEDIDLMYEWENDTSLWGVSGTTTPFSRHVLSLFIESQREDIFSCGQMRLMITLHSQECIGMVDLFDIDTHNSRAGIGIMICSEQRGKEYAKDAILTLEKYCREYLLLHQLWCNVTTSNIASLSLFKGTGYETIGTKREWIYSKDGYLDEVMLQKII